jgi:hypothetical protein
VRKIEGEEKAKYNIILIEISALNRTNLDKVFDLLINT